MQDELGFQLVAPIQTVHAKLKECNALAMLSDDSMAVATQVVTPDPGKSRSQIQREIKQKEHAIEYLARRYRSAAAKPSQAPPSPPLTHLHPPSPPSTYLQVARAAGGGAQAVFILHRRQQRLSVPGARSGRQDDLVPQGPLPRVRRSERGDLPCHHWREGRRALDALTPAPVCLRAAVADIVEGDRQRHVSIVVRGKPSKQQHSKQSTTHPPTPPPFYRPLPSTHHHLFTAPFHPPTTTFLPASPLPCLTHIGTLPRTTCCARTTPTSKETPGKAHRGSSPRRARPARCTSCCTRRSRGAGTGWARP